MMLDATKQDIQRQLLEKELESVGIRLNKRKPNIYFKVIYIINISIVSTHGRKLTKFFGGLKPPSP